MKGFVVVLLVGLLSLSACANSQSCPGGYASANWCHAPSGGVSDSN